VIHNSARNLSPRKAKDILSRRSRSATILLGALSRGRERVRHDPIAREIIFGWIPTDTDVSTLIVDELGTVPLPVHLTKAWLGSKDERCPDNLPGERRLLVSSAGEYIESSSLMFGGAVVCIGFCLCSVSGI